jgi:hypothetical protein
MSFRELVARASPWSWVAATVLWAVAVIALVKRLVDLISVPYFGWLFDWHVYAAGARDFISGDLYHVPLVSDYRIPVSAFNLPPGTAMTAIPFIALPDDIGGLFWVLLGYAGVAGVAVVAAAIVGARPIWLWSGAAFFVYALSDLARAGLMGNNTALVLLLVAGFVATRLANRPALSGLLLGVAIASKLWPAALLVPLARERSWRTFAWAAGSAALILGVAILWLGGLGVIGPMMAAISIDIEPKENKFLLAFTWLRVHTDWWPIWGGYLIAVLLLLIPARGLTGYGLAVLAGLAAIPNLWLHYIPTILFAILLVIRGLLSWRSDRLASRQDRTAAGARMRGAATDHGLGP